jgi:hypothetical protein
VFCCVITPKKPNNLKVENSIMKQQGIFYEKIKIHTDAQIINMLKQNQAEESVANLCREHGMSQATF